MRPLFMWWMHRNRALVSGREDWTLENLAELTAINARRREFDDPDGASVELDALVRRLPDWPFPHVTRAIWELHAGHLTEAKASAAVALALAPGDPVPYQVLVRILEREGQTEVAEAVRAQHRRVCELWGIDLDALQAEAATAPEAGGC